MNIFSFLHERLPENLKTQDKKVISNLRKQKADLKLTSAMLNLINAPSPVASSAKTSLPGPDFPGLIERREDLECTFSFKDIIAFEKRFPIHLDAVASDGKVVLSAQKLKETGLKLLPWVSFGILAGGSATSYVDETRNKQFYPQAFETYKDFFSKQGKEIADKPKSLVPAFFNKDLSEGPSFLELKIRSIAALIHQYVKKYGQHPLVNSAPLFLMTNAQNDSIISSAIHGYMNSPIVRPLLKDSGITSLKFLTGIQPLISAFSKNPDGNFDLFHASQKSCAGLALPGGHGHNFYVLKEIYQKLQASGKKFVYLTNIDNLGAVIDPVSLAILALKGARSAFEFSHKTALDKKGGILGLLDGHPACLEIGGGISSAQVEQYEQQGVDLLFNCATGFFDLDDLTKNIDFLVSNLPVRINVNKKDIGIYFQAEQNTWESIALLDSPFILAVEKSRRFIPAKTILETFFNSGLIRDGKDYRPEYGVLYEGFKSLMEKSYGFIDVQGTWVALSPEKFKL